MPATYRVSREDGMWYVEDTSTRKWWTVADDRAHVVNQDSRTIKPGSKLHRAIVTAIEEHAGPA